jgi:predicted GTPase
MAAQTEGFRYANLAMRGKLIHQVVIEQVPMALKLIEAGTLVSFHAVQTSVNPPKLQPCHNFSRLMQKQYVIYLMS